MSATLTGRRVAEACRCDPCEIVHGWGIDCGHRVHGWWRVHPVGSRTWLGCTAEAAINLALAQQAERDVEARHAAGLASETELFDAMHRVCACQEEAWR